MIATSCFLTALECNKFVFGRGFAPGPARGAYTALPRPCRWSKGPTSKGKGRERKMEGHKRDPLYANSWIGSCQLVILSQDGL